MQAKDVMTAGVVAINQHATLRQVTARMVSERLFGFPVTDNYERLVGVITELDVIKALLDGLDPKQAVVEEVMTRQIPSVAADAPMLDVLRALNTDRITRVPVIHNGVMVGLISREDMLRASLPSQAA